MVRSEGTRVTFAPALPLTYAGEISRRVRDAGDAKRAVRIVGAGTWPQGGFPTDAVDTISCVSHREIIEYVPGDLTITVGAGMTLSAIADAVAEHDQWLTLDPFGSSAGTVGATVSTASFGPLATGFGTPRDLVLGLEAVTGTGDVIRGGGRVVKNVAGFDLVRLFTGSRGTLGVITEVTLRLRARPTKDLTVAIGVDGTSSGLRTVCRALREWPFIPMAAEILDGACAAAVGLPQKLTLLLRLGGNAKAVAAQQKRAMAVGKPIEVENGVWDKVRGVERGAAGVARILDLPMAFAERWTDAQQLAGKTGVLLGSPVRGAIRCVMGEVDGARVAAFRGRAKTAAMVFDSLPTASAWHSLTQELNPSSLDARVRSVFDPSGILNPGIMRVTR
jgi:FAD/FMN-containing dehydrogenase